jgi:hypothetical protein
MGAIGSVIIIATVLLVVITSSTPSPATAEPSVDPSSGFPVTPSDSTASSEPPSETATNRVSKSPPSAPKPAYLTDLDPQVPDNSETGLAFIGGQRYQHSFLQSICFDYPVITVLPDEYRKLTVTVGYDDDSFSRTGVSVVVYTTSEPDPNEESKWSLLDKVKLPTQKKGLFLEESLPVGTTGVRLGPASYACSTGIAWGDPLVSP